MSTTLTEAVRELAQERRSLAEAKAVIAARRAEFEASVAAAVATAKLFEARVAAAETTVQALAADVYAETDERKPAPGVEIKLFTTLAYDEAAALSWCRLSGVAVIPEQVDRTAFEKIAKATPLPFVSYHAEPRVQIATDLDKALASAEVTA